MQILDVVNLGIKIRWGIKNPFFDQFSFWGAMGMKLGLTLRGCLPKNKNIL